MEPGEKNHIEFMDKLIPKNGISIGESLALIQMELKAPKNQFNKFGKYNYRSCEDILEAVKPLVCNRKLTLTITDTVKEAGSYVYVEAKCSLSNGGDRITVTAQAGIEKAGGMQLAQAFGSASSYARKYALNGLFLIDDTKDADAHKDFKTMFNNADNLDELILLWGSLTKKEQTDNLKLKEKRKDELRS